MDCVCVCVCVCVWGGGGGGGKQNCMLEKIQVTILLPSLCHIGEANHYPKTITPVEGVDQVIIPSTPPQGRVHCPPKTCDNNKDDQSRTHKSPWRNEFIITNEKVRVSTKNL